jgi:hypothetical protein
LSATQSRREEIYNKKKKSENIRNTGRKEQHAAENSKRTSSQVVSYLWLLDIDARFQKKKRRTSRFGFDFIVVMWRWDKRDSFKA